MTARHLLADLRAGFVRLGLELSDGQQAKLLDYLALITKWNRVYNLTAVRDEGEMLTHHVLDTLAIISPLKKYNASSNLATATLLDVGSGAGLPGVVIAICCPDVEVTCVDAVGKKAAFVQQVATALKLSNLHGLHARVEKISSTYTPHGFDIITSRAFSSLGHLAQLTSPLLAPGGVWMAMKATRLELEQEVSMLSAAIKVFHVEQLFVPRLSAERCLVWMRQ